MVSLNLIVACTQRLRSRDLGDLQARDCDFALCPKIWSYPGCSQAETDSNGGIQKSLVVLFSIGITLGMAMLPGE